MSEEKLEPLFVSIIVAANYTSESPWVVKDRLRRGVYLARKAGRRTLVELASVKAFAENLPAAKFAAPRKRQTEAA